MKRKLTPEQANAWLTVLTHKLVSAHVDWPAPVHWTRNTDELRIVGAYPTVAGDDRFITTLYRYKDDVLMAYVERVLESNKICQGGQMGRFNLDPETFASDIHLDIEATDGNSGLRESFVYWHPFIGEHVRFWGDISLNDSPFARAHMKDTDLEEGITRFISEVPNLIPAGVSIEKLEVAREDDTLRCRIRTDETSEFLSLDMTSVPLVLNQVHENPEILAAGLTTTIISDIVDSIGSNEDIRLSIDPIEENGIVAGPYLGLATNENHEAETI